ncbi:MAG: hypothetical protein ACRBFS_13590 [Aureispira sp.]
MKLKALKVLSLILFLLLFSQCSNKPSTYNIPFTTTDFAALITPNIQRQGKDLLVCKNKHLELHNVKEQKLNWSYDLQHTLRGCLLLEEQMLTVVSYVQDEQQIAILKVIDANKGHLLRQDTLSGRVDFLWAIPDSKDYLIQTTVFRDSTINSYLQRRSTDADTALWSSSKVLLSPPSVYHPPYAYIGQAHKIYVLDVDKGTLTANCSAFIDSTILFYQQQAPQKAKRELNWHQHIQNTCQLEQEAWQYKIDRANKPQTILGNEGETQLYSVSPNNKKPKHWQTLQAPLKEMIPTSGSYIYQLEEEANNLYYYDPKNKTRIMIPLAGKPIQEAVINRSFLTYQYPYVTYLQQDKETANYLITCQQVDY